MKHQVKEGKALIEHISRLRSKVGVIYGWPQIGKSAYAINLAKACAFSYIDVTQQLLPTLQHEVGIYDNNDFVDYLLSQIRHEEFGLIVDEVEPLLATFGKPKVAVFFQSLIYIEPVNPLIIVTRLTSFVQNTNIASERFLLFER